MKNQANDSELIQDYLNSKDPELREQLIVRYLPLVRYVIGRLGYSSDKFNSIDDLESQGVIGLIEAVDNYDPKFGAQLSTYATLKIRSKVLDYLREIDWLPRSARERVKNLQKAISELQNKLHRMPSDSEIASHLEISQDEYQKALIDSSRIIVSLDQEDYKDDSQNQSAPLYDRLEDEKQTDPFDNLEDKDTRSELISSIKLLPERDQQILSLYYYNDLTFKEIGQVLGVSESRICQIHSRAVLTLKEKMNQG